MKTKKATATTKIANLGLASPLIAIPQRDNMHTFIYNSLTFLIFKKPIVPAYLRIV